MPKLNPQLAGGVKEAAASSGFTPLEPGTYRARLVEVEAKQAASSGNPMWVWKYEILDDKYKGRFQWNNTVLTDKALWKVAESFSAFGVDTDTDTDELIGCTVKLEVSQRVIQQGARQGQTGDNVDRVLPDDDASAIRHPNSELEGGSSAGSGPAPVSAAEIENRF